MSKGRAIVKHVGSEGIVGYETAGQYDFLYRVSTSVDPKFDVGDRIALADGREYRYAKSASALSTSEGCYAGGTGVVAYKAATESVAVGEREVTVPAATHSALAKDELKGGYVIIFGSVSDGADMMFRGIIGNPASSANTALTLILDGMLDVAIDSSSAYEVYANPYSAATWDTGSPTRGKIGVPAAYVSAASMYFWLKIKGPHFINVQSTVVGNEGVGLMWRGDGSVDAIATVMGDPTVPDVDTTQIAGYRLIGDYDNNGPIIMLTGM